MSVIAQPNNASDSAPESSPESGAKNRINPVVVLVMLLSTIGLFALVAVLGSNRNPSPPDNSPEAGFARDMIVHHSQAVDMGMLLYDRTQDAALKIIGFDIAMTQQNQIGQMQGWLALWGLNYSGVALPMTWMGTPVEGLMPGMATEDQMAALRAATGVDADKLFIELMIPHHQAAIHMAQSVLTLTSNPVLERFARSVIDGQQREIAELQKIGDSIGAQVVPLNLDHEDHEEATPGG